MQQSSIVKWEKRIRISTAIIFAILMMLNIYISEKFKTDFVFFQTLIMYILLFFQMGFNLLQFLSHTTNKHIRIIMILLYTYAYISNFIVLLILLISPIDSMLVLTMVLTFFTLSFMFLITVEHQFKKRIKKKSAKFEKSFKSLTLAIL
ncbi:putative Na+-dependent transporter [Staphylococcus cohnii]